MTPEERASKFCQATRHNWEPGVYSSRCNCDAIADEIRTAVEEEREACAQIAVNAYEEPDGNGHVPDWYAAAYRILDDIRSRGKA